jgi:hypothetical protein
MAKKTPPKFKKLPHNISPETVKSKLADMSQAQLKFHSENHPNEKVRDVIKNHIRTHIPVMLNTTQLAGLHHRLNNMSDAELQKHAESHPNEKVRNIVKSHLAKKGQMDIFGDSPKGGVAIEPKKIEVDTSPIGTKKKKGPEQMDIFGTAPKMLPRTGVDVPAVGAKEKGFATFKTVPKTTSRKVDVSPGSKGLASMRRKADLAHKNPEVRAKAVSHIDTHRSELLHALSDSHEDVRSAAASHPSATRDHLNFALHDQSPKVRLAAVNNINATKHHLTFASTDKDSEVANTAKEKLGRGIQATPIRKPEYELSKSPGFATGTSSTAAGHNVGLLFGKLVSGLGKGIGKVAEKGKSAVGKMSKPKKVPKKRIEPTF